MVKPWIAKQFIVGLDFDGVLALGVDIKRKYAKKWYGIDLPLEATKEAGFDSFMRARGQPYTYHQLIGEIIARHMMEYKVPQGCQQTLNALSKRGVAYVTITSRRQSYYEPMVQFCHEHFPSIRYFHNTKDQPKTDFAKRLRLRAYVDDGLSKLQELRDIPLELIYFRQEENRREDLGRKDKDRIHEAKSWKAIEDLIIDVMDLHEAICWDKGCPNNVYASEYIFQESHKMPRERRQKLLQRYRSQVR
ncbi:MAG: hypothetical protein KJ709_08920 [Nanoarchaeota archaeon]|nr:hypothetical protein [Nanoarchaeota archaeon]